MKLNNKNNFAQVKNIKMELLKDTFAKYKVIQANNQLSKLRIQINENFSSFINDNSVSAINLKKEVGSLVLESFGIFEQLKEITQKLAETIKHEMSGDRLWAKIEAFEQWADFGWIIHDNLDIDEIYNPPNSQAEADAMVMSVHNDKEMFVMLEEIKKNNFTDKDMIDDIIFLFENGRYNSCIAITLNAIDRIKLNHMILDNSSGKFKYVVGRKRSLINKEVSFTRTEKIRDYHLTFLLAHNTLKLLNRIFAESANNWKSEPNYVVRDFINHGMTNRKWNKTDTIKIILLLINFSKLSEFIIKIVLIDEVN